MPELLDHLCRKGWLERGKPLADSRFGRLIAGDNAIMAGVFSGYEQEILAGWMEAPGAPLPPAPLPPQLVSSQAAMEDADPEKLLAGLSPARHFTPQGLGMTRAFCRQWIGG